MYRMPFSSIYAIHKSSNKGHFPILHDLQKMSPVTTTVYVHCYKHMKQNSRWVRFKRPRWRATHLYKNPWKMSLCWGKNLNLASSHFLSRIKFIHLFKYKIWQKERKRNREGDESYLHTETPMRRRSCRLKSVRGKHKIRWVSSCVYPSYLHSCSFLTVRKASLSLHLNMVTNSSVLIYCLPDARKVFCEDSSSRKAVAASIW